MPDIEKKALPIQDLPLIIYNHCLTMVVAVVIQEIVKLYSCDESWLNILFLPFSEEGKRL